MFFRSDINLLISLWYSYIFNELIRGHSNHRAQSVDEIIGQIIFRLNVMSEPLKGHSNLVRHCAEVVSSFLQKWFNVVHN